MSTHASSAQVTALVAEILGRGSAVRFKVTGGSMRPLVPSGARVVVGPVDTAKLRAGDVVYFKNTQGAPVLHRIVRVDLDSAGRKVFRTKGDALIVFDDPVAPDQVLGRAVRIERPLPGGRRWVLDLDTRRWRWAGAVVAVLQLVGAKVLLKLGVFRKKCCRLKGQTAGRDEAGPSEIHRQ
ncbi:MAG: signal peptidase I [Pseudomonadota bacterium]